MAKSTEPDDGVSTYKNMKENNEGVNSPSRFYSKFLLYGNGIDKKNIIKV